MIYATADLHGMHPNQFQKLLDKAGFSDDDFLFILGDVIDRGQFGAEFLAWLTQMPNIQLILGNHEAQLLACSFLFEEVSDSSLDALSTEHLALVQNWIDNGGMLTMKGFRKLLKADPELVAGILDYLEDTPLFDEISVNGKTYVLVHSGFGEDFHPDRALEDYTPEELLFNRPDLLTVYYPSKKVIFGHTPTGYYGDRYRGKPIYTGTWIDIDTGVAAGFSPVLLCLDTMQEYYL